jgi:hypothetical protein
MTENNKLKKKDLQDLPIGKGIAPKEAAGKVSEHSVAMLTIRGQEPLAAVPALFSNFVAISRVGTEVQLEFIFLDLNQIAGLLEAAREGKSQELNAIGKTVAKIIVPAAAFIQLKEHVTKLFVDIETQLKSLTEAQSDRNRATS